MDQRDRDVLRHAGASAAPGLVRVLSSIVPIALALAVSLLRPAECAAAEVVQLVPAAVLVTPGRWAAAATSQDPEVRRRGAELDRTIAEALEDMGMVVQPLAQSIPSDAELAARAREAWVMAPRFELRPGGVWLRIVAVTPGSRVLFVREEDLEGRKQSALPVRSVVMVRDLVEAGRQRREPRPETPRRSRVDLPPPPPRSSGRPVLALNAAVFGGYLGFTLQRASGSRDSRLVYPMVALGAGLGLGASLLVADEWDIENGHAWYLSAGMVWPGAAGFLLAESYGAELQDRYLYGLAGATTGIGLATVALATGNVSEGGAVLTHSGGAFGMLFGAMTQVAVEGTTEGTPTRGMGFGTGIGTLAAGVLATQVDTSAERMLFVDLSASLGALAGAAVASPLLFVEETDPTRTRLWLGAVTAGAIVGGVVGWFATDDVPGESSGLHVIPYATRGLSPYGSSYDLGVLGRF